MIYLFILLLALLILFLLWRLKFFFRDPERNIPKGNNIVSPADGTVVYVKEVLGTEVPISVKNHKKIALEEIFKRPLPRQPYFMIGIFMHPTSVHVNRAPIAGKIQRSLHTKARNLPMTLTWWRAMLGIKPYEKYSDYLIQNERQTTIFKGKFDVCVTQIADIYVSKIDNWISEGQDVEKGERFGRIIFGSQVDTLIPKVCVKSVLVKEGQKVFAGETILAEY